LIKARLVTTITDVIAVLDAMIAHDIIVMIIQYKTTVIGVIAVEFLLMRVIAVDLRSTELV